MSDKNLTLAALLIASLVAPTPLIAQSSHYNGQSRSGRNQENSAMRDDVYQRTQNNAGSNANMIKRDDDTDINQGRTMQGYTDGNLVSPSKKPVTIRHYYPQNIKSSSIHSSNLKFAKGGLPTHQGYDTGYAAILDKKKQLGGGRLVIAKDNLSKGHTGQGYDDGKTINGDNKFISINAYKPQNSSITSNANYLYKISKKGHGSQGYSYGFSPNTIQNSFTIKSFNKY